MGPLKLNDPWICGSQHFDAAQTTGRSFRGTQGIPLLTLSTQVVKLLLAAKAGTCHAGSFSQSWVTSYMGMYQNQSCYIWGDEHPFTSYLGLTRVPRFWLIPIYIYYVQLITHMRVSWNGGTPKSSIYFNRHFQYRRSIWRFMETSIYTHSDHVEP
jgi:hypothetical protein